MTDGFNLLQELNAMLDQLNLDVTEIAECGRTEAKAERDYRIALAVRMAELKVEKCPATTMSDFARGTDHIAELKEKRDVASIMTYAAKEALQVHKRKQQFLSEQYAREWGRNG